MSSKMLQFSYWLFPLIFLVFVFVPPLQPFLLPGLVAAGVAGAANSAVLEKYPAVIGHALAAALCIYWMQRPKRSEREADPLERSAAMVAWALATLVICYLLPEKAWPYALSRKQMLAIFLPFLLVGAVTKEVCGVPARRRGCRVHR